MMCVNNNLRYDIVSNVNSTIVLLEKRGNVFTAYKVKQHGNQTVVRCIPEGKSIGVVTLILLCKGFCVRDRQMFKRRMKEKGEPVKQNGLIPR